MYKTKIVLYNLDYLTFSAASEEAKVFFLNKIIEIRRQVQKCYDMIEVIESLPLLTGDYNDVTEKKEHTLDLVEKLHKKMMLEEVDMLNENA